MECTASQSILFRSASFCLTVVFFPGNHKAIVIHLRDLDAHKGFSRFCIIGQRNYFCRFLCEIIQRSHGKINVHGKMIFSCRVILCLINGGSQTKNGCIRNFQCIYACITGNCPGRGTVSPVLIHRDPFPLLCCRIIPGKRRAAGTFTLLQKIKLVISHFHILRKRMPEIIINDLTRHGLLIHSDHQKSLMTLA